MSCAQQGNKACPGEFIAQVYLEPNNLSGRELAAKLGVAASTLNRILVGSSRISPEMALRLSKALGRSPESWLAMQSNYDLWQAKQHLELSKVGKVRLTDHGFPQAPRDTWQERETFEREINLNHWVNRGLSPITHAGLYGLLTAPIDRCY